MFNQSPRNRSSRANNGFKVKHALQLILMGAGIWLLYQTQRSYNKGKTYGEGTNVSEKLHDDGVRKVIYGRKDFPNSEEKLKLDGRSNANEDKSEEKPVEETRGESMEKQNEEGKEERKVVRGEHEDEGKKEDDRSEERGKVENNDGEEVKDDVENKIKEQQEENKEKENQVKEEKGNNNDEQGGGENKIDEKGKEENDEDKKQRKVSYASGGEFPEQQSKGDGSDKKSVENEVENNDSKFENSGSSDGDNKESNSSASEKNEESFENKTVGDEAKHQSADTIESNEDKQANATTTFSDETFASQNDATNYTSASDVNPNLLEITEKPEKRDSSANENHSDPMYDATANTEYSTSSEGVGSSADGNSTFADTSGHKGANGENPERPLVNYSLSETNQTAQSYGESSSGEPKEESFKALDAKKHDRVESEHTADVQRRKYSSKSNENSNVDPLKKGETSHEKEDEKEENVEHHYEGDNVTQDVKDQTDLDTLPDTGNDASNNRDATAK